MIEDMNNGFSRDEGLANFNKNHIDLKYNATLGVRF